MTRILVADFEGYFFDEELAIVEHLHGRFKFVISMVLVNRFSKYIAVTFTQCIAGQLIYDCELVRIRNHINVTDDMSAHLVKFVFYRRADHHRAGIELLSKSGFHDETEDLQEFGLFENRTKRQLQLMIHQLVKAA